MGCASYFIYEYKIFHIIVLGVHEHEEYQAPLCAANISLLLAGKTTLDDVIGRRFSVQMMSSRGVLFGGFRFHLVARFRDAVCRLCQRPPSELLFDI